MNRFEKSFDSTKSRLLIGGVAAALVVGSAVTISMAKNDKPAYSPSSHSTEVSGSQSRNAKPAADMALHENIIATVFWVGEAASEDNDYIQNRSSAWQEDWMGHYGGEDNPDDRCGYKPCNFEPKENPFYFALPFNDYQENGQAKPVSVLQKIPWYEGQPQPGTSLVKNRWVEITNNDTTTYAQWEDVGPFGEDDVGYVFGANRPQERRAGIDLSPATADYLHIDGRGTVSWKFVEDAQVPAGPWKEVITASGIQF